MFTKLCHAPSESPDAEELALVRALRQHARMLMKQMLAEMGTQAASLKYSRDAHIPQQEPAEDAGRSSRG